MLNVIKENIGTIIVAAVLFFTVGLIILRMVKNKKEGKSSCGCGCGACPMSEECNKK